MNWIILFTPLVAALLIAVFLHPHRLISVYVSIAACAVSFVGVLLLILAPEVLEVSRWIWVDLPGLEIGIGAMNDRLAHMMLLVVTGVGLCIHVFAYGYMKDDPGLSRFFAELSLFMFSMLGIVLADNLVMMFIFWELVGLSSYLLIGFWFNRASAADAAKKAFIVNRVGDFGFMLGILGVWWIWGSVDFAKLESLIAVAGIAPGVTQDAVNWVAFGLFMGCMGKSAMVPLHVWLPDAMEGPTPVSALIHAATMVAAGVYMLCRVFFVLQLAPLTLEVITWVGAGTALMAAFIATQQNDIKKILAYSTLSQLGYMVMAVGLKATVASMYHLTTHAFFKALLFLAAGSVIHALHHEQDIWKMGGLRKKMPITFWTFLIGTAALAGVPFFSGFFSKEEILLHAYHQHTAIFAVGLFTAFLTAFYMTRLFVVAFLGSARGSAVDHAHESPAVMTWPLLALAVLSAAGGYLGILHFMAPDYRADHTGAALVVGASVIALLSGVAGGWILYSGGAVERIRLSVLERKFYFDELYTLLLVRPQQAWSRALDWVDQWIIGGVLVRGIAAVGTFTGEVLRLLQAGHLQAYAYFFVLGVVFLCYWILFRSPLN
ncbi:MAG: NADH-quinone oxidoreductase subunit L [Candidatus Methylacidiphilales bacterium]